MKLLAVGFDRSAQERLSAALSQAGHQVLAASGQVSARTLARAATPDALVVPGGPAGELAASWVSDLLPGLRAFVLPADADSAEVVRMVGNARPVAAPAEPDGEGASRALSSAPNRDLDGGGEGGSAAALAVTPGRPAALAHAAAPDSRIASKLADVRFGDYHAILETSDGTSPALVREQYERLSHLFTPAGWPGAVGAADIAHLDEISRGLEDAFTILDDPDLRARYERALKSAGRRPAAGAWS